MPFLIKPPKERVKTTKESWRSRLDHIPEGTAALFFVQIFATLGFAVLYSTLVLYATRHLHFSVKEASAIKTHAGVSRQPPVGG